MQTSKTSFADFHLILLGVERWISDRDSGNYQLSDFTQLAVNLIHARQVHRGDTVTLTHVQTLNYLTQPLEAIFDIDTELPEDIEFVQLVDEGWGDGYELGDGVNEYLRKAGLDSIQLYDEFVFKRENKIAGNTYQRFDRAYRMETSSVEQRRIEGEYADWRLFLCENNVVNSGDMFFNKIWLTVRDTYYDPAHILHHRVVFTEADGAKYYLFSPTSGLLYKNATGDFVPIKWVAGFEGVAHAERIAVRNKDYILKQTHQKQILISGIPEVMLYRQLKNHPKVKDVRLYPGVDRYDLRVELNTGDIHAIDIKTYRRSASLENKLKKRKKDPKPRIDAHEQSELSFDRFLFLFPERYIVAKGYPQGLRKLKKLAQRHDMVEVDTIENYLKDWFNV